MTKNNSIIKLNDDQTIAVNTVKEFVKSKNDIFVFTGAAGTGKTTVVKNIIGAISDDVDQVILLAPTNRAAKVLSKKTNILANTVHSEIYILKEDKNSDGVVISTKFVPRIHSLLLDDKDKELLKSKKNIYIVDESSMLSDAAVKDADLISDNGLLSDFYRHVKYFTPQNKIIFVGDHYQLPPINYDGIAPALDVNYLKENFTKELDGFELTKIHRQEEGSVILKLAKELKEKIDLKIDKTNLKLARFSGYADFINKFSSVYEFDRPLSAIALAWRRVDVLQMNIDIRRKLFNGNVGVFEEGDMVYLNAKWKYSSTSIPKGEIGKVIEVISNDGSKGGLNFHTLKIEFLDLENNIFNVKSKVLSDYPYSKEDTLPKQLFQKLAIARSKENGLFKKSKEAKNDEYMSAMQLKFAYALTVHKAQGGEWENVFLHALTNWKDLRWNYTAVTRASKQIYSFFR